MKKFIKITAVICSLAASLFVTGCNDVIFAEIREEVKLENAQIKGDVRSIVRFDDKLWVQNGNIYSKDIYTDGELTREHNWQKMKNPETTSKKHFRYVNKLAADDSYLYAQLSRIDYDENDGENEATNSSIFCTTDGISWEKVTIAEKTAFAPKTAKIFSTNQETGNEAYAKISDKLYKLNGTSASEITTPDYLEGTTDIASIKSCIKFGGKTIFSKANALVTDGTNLWNSNGTYIYHRTDASETGTKSKDMGGSVLSIDYSNDYLVVGTTDGLKYCVRESDGKTGNVESLFNSESTLSTYYDVYAVLVTEHSKDVAKTIVYGTTTFQDSPSSTSAETKNCGLWSYYEYRPNGNSGKWNKE